MEKSKATKGFQASNAGLQFRGGLEAGAEMFVLTLFPERYRPMNGPIKWTENFEQETKEDRNIK